MCGGGVKDTGKVRRMSEGARGLDGLKQATHTYTHISYLGERIGYRRGRRHRGRAKWVVERARVVESVGHGTPWLPVWWGARLTRMGLPSSLVEGWRVGQIRGMYRRFQLR